nr:hypothetical protein Iba_chr07aCG16120 [Ipomoea batatas]
MINHLGALDWFTAQCKYGGKRISAATNKSIKWLRRSHRMCFKERLSGDFSPMASAVKQGESFWGFRGGFRGELECTKGSSCAAGRVTLRGMMGSLREIEGEGCDSVGGGVMELIAALGDGSALCYLVLDQELLAALGVVFPVMALAVEACALAAAAVWKKECLVGSLVPPHTYEDFLKGVLLGLGLWNVWVWLGVAAQLPLRVWLASPLLESGAERVPGTTPELWWQRNLLGVEGWVSLLGLRVQTEEMASWYPLPPNSGIHCQRKPEGFGCGRVISAELAGVGHCCLIGGIWEEDEVEDLLYWIQIRA